MSKRGIDTIVCVVAFISEIDPIYNIIRKIYRLPEASLLISLFLGIQVPVLYPEKNIVNYKHVQENCFNNMVNIDKKTFQYTPKQIQTEHATNKKHQP